MGGAFSSDEQRQDIYANRQRKGQFHDTNCLQKLPKIFSQHYNNVMSLVETTVAQQEYVDQLMHITTDKSLADMPLPPAVLKGREILDRMQAGRFIQTLPTQDSLIELYHNIQAILQNYNIPAFDIDSPFLKDNYKQNWNRSSAPLRDNSDEVTGRLTQAVHNDMQQREITQLKEQLSKRQKCISKLEKDNAKSSFEIARLTQIVEQLRQDCSQQKYNIEKIQDERESLEREVEKLRPPKISATIQLFHSHSGNTIKDIETELKSMLKTQLNGVSFIKSNKVNEVDPSKMLIVLCIIASRVGTDAANAIRHIANPANTALLLFHIKESHALSKQASNSVLTDQSFKALGGIFDLAFVNGKGIYQCEMNDNALDGVCTFIKQNI